MRERDDIPVMLLGLKRDLRVEGEGIIYPEEVSKGNGVEFGLFALSACCCALFFRAKVNFCEVWFRRMLLLRKCVVIDMLNVPL